MKRFARLAFHALTPALGGLLFGAILVGFSISIYSLFSQEMSFSHFTAAWSIGMLFAIFSFAYGFLPALFFGAPAYALLMYLGRANYLTVTLIGCIPGFVLLPLAPDYGKLFLLFGVPVAIIAHFLAKRSTQLHKLGAN